MSGQYPPPPPNQPPHQPPGQSGPPGQQPGQPGQPSWGAAPPPSYQPTQGYTPQYPSYGGGPTGPTGPTGPYQGYPPPGQGGGGGGGKGLLITTIVVGAVAVIAAITTMIIVLTGDDEESAGGGDPTSQTDEPTSETEEPTESTSEPDPEPEPEPTSEPPAPDGAVPLGTAAPVGDWSVTVTEFDDDADAEIKKANQFNDPPSGRYVLATIAVTYNGTGEGNVSFGLSTSVVGPGGDEHKDYDCGAVEPRSSISAPPLKKGDSYTFDSCYDVPVASIEGATLTVNQDFDEATEVVFDL